MENGNSVAAIPNFVTSQFAISAGPRDISLMLGETVHLIDPSTGQPTVEGKQWSGSFVMSPITAHQLHEALTKVLKNYETNFGKIPVDPRLAIETNATTGV